VVALVVVGASGACGESSDGSGGQGTTSATGGTGTTSSAGGSGGATTAPGGSGGTGGAGGGEAMGFFITSLGNGAMGGDHGGLTGADAFCQGLADAVGAGARSWRAYLSTSQVDARDRIGAGPWRNAAGQVVAADLASLHAGGIDPALMLTEAGAPPDGEVPGQEHDILTGSNEDGTAHGNTCQDWTSNDSSDSARVGHHDWSIIPNPVSPNQNWNSVHNTPCDEAGLVNNLGTGRLYCFAAD
jgi:hypothetical protein